MLTGRQLNCLRGSSCLSQIEIRLGEKAKCDIATSDDVRPARQVSFERFEMHWRKTREIPHQCVAPYRSDF
jgi:hypothetical protein